MSFLKALFSSKEENNDEREKKEDTKNFEALKYDGVRALHSNQFAYAIQCFNHALELKDDAETHDYLSQALIGNQELLPAYEQLSKLSEIVPDNIKVCIRMADVAYMMEDYASMADACKRAMAIDDSDVQVLYRYAKAYIGQKDNVNAVAVLSKALAINDKYGDAYLLRGETLLEMGDINGADQDADFLLSHVEGNEDVLLLKARIEEKKGNHTEAISYYDKTIEANPFCVDAFKERGAVKFTIGDKNGAEEDLKTVLELAPSDAEEVNGEFKN